MPQVGINCLIYFFFSLRVLRKTNTNSALNFGFSWKEQIIEKTVTNFCKNALSMLEELRINWSPMWSMLSDLHLLKNSEWKLQRKQRCFTWYYVMRTIRYILYTIYYIRYDRISVCRRTAVSWSIKNSMAHRENKNTYSSLNQMIYTVSFGACEVLGCLCRMYLLTYLSRWDMLLFGTDTEYQWFFVSINRSIFVRKGSGQIAIKVKALEL